MIGTPAQARGGQRVPHRRHRAGRACLLGIAERQHPDQGGPRQARPGPRVSPAERGLVVAPRQEYREFEPAAQLGGSLRGGGQVGCRLVAGQTHVGAQVRRGDSAQRGQAGRRRRRVRARSTAGRPAGMTRPSALPTVTTDGPSAAAPRRCARGTRRHGSPPLVEHRDLRWPRGDSRAGRRGRRLVRGVGPVPLVLHLPQVAGEAEPDPAT